MSERIAGAIDCDFGIWPKSVMIASATRTEHLQSPGDLVFRIKTAIDEWLKSTPRGQDAYVESCEAFNAGDLLQHRHEPSLVARLAEQGVKDFDLSAPIQLTDWSHDEPLTGLTTRSMTMQKLHPP